MNKKSLLVRVFALITFFVFGVTNFVSSAVLDKEFKGITYTSYTKDGYCSPESDQKIKNLNTTGANWISLIVSLYQDSVTSNEVQMHHNQTTDFACIDHAVNELRKNPKQKILLKPHIDFPNDIWEVGLVMPSNPIAWLLSYEKAIVTCAIMAEWVGAEMFCIGTNLYPVTTPEYASYWNP